MVKQLHKVRQYESLSGPGLKTNMFLGPDLIPFLMLALGAALFVGNGLALLRPRDEPKADDELKRAPLGRSLVMVLVGLIASVWAFAPLVG